MLSCSLATAVLFKYHIQLHQSLDSFCSSAVGARRLRSACFEADGAQEEFVSLQAAKRQRGGTIQSACALLSRYHALRWHQITNGSRRTQVRPPWVDWLLVWRHQVMLDTCGAACDVIQCDRAAGVHG